MTIDLLNTPMLGHWDVDASTSQCEFQFGTKLIYVQHPKGSDPRPYLRSAQDLVQLVWEDSENAIAYAETWFRLRHPEFWSVWDKAVNPEYPLIFYSIHFGVADPHPGYYIACSPSYDFECVWIDEFDPWQKEVRKQLPYFPESDGVVVTRLAPASFCLSHS